MAITITKGYTFGSTELVTNTKLHTLVDSSIIDASDPGAIGGTTPAAGTFTTLIGTNIDGIIGANTPAAGAFTTLTGDGSALTGITSGVAADGTVNPTNLLSNGDFESWSAGTSAAPDEWTKVGSYSSAAREGSTVKLGTYSAKFTSAHVYQSIHSEKGIDYWKSRTATIGAWVWADTASKVRLNLYDGVSNNLSSYHTGGSTWEWLSVTGTIGASATEVTFYISGDVADNDIIEYIDGAMLVEGASAFAFSPKPLSASAQIVAEVDETKFSHKLPVVINGTTYYIMLTTT